MQHRFGRSAIARLLLAAAAVVVAGAVPRQAVAQTYPTKPVRFVVPYAPGGIADIAARIIGAKLTEAWGQQVVVENKPGGNGTIGVATIAKAAPDGYALLIATVGDFTLNPNLQKDLPYDVVNDLTPITALTDTPCVLAVHSEAPYKTVADLIADAKLKPGKIPYATPGNGSINQLIMEWTGLGTGTRFQHIPYKGGAPAGASVAAGDVPIGVLAVSSALPHLKSGRARVLAVTTAKRSPFNPEWPTLRESGVPDVDGSNWTALMAPKGTPQPILDKLHADVLKVLAMADVKERLAAGSASPIPTTPAELAAIFARESAAFKAIIQKADIKAE